MSYAATYGNRDRVPVDRVLRREGHPLGVRRYYDDPADEVVDTDTSKKWTFGVAAGALLVAGTFAAGALGLNGSSLPVADQTAPEHASAAPGHGPNNSDGGGSGDIGTPAVAAPPHGGHDPGAGPAEKAAADERASAAASGQQGGSAQSGSGSTVERSGSGGEQAAQANPAPAPAPAPAQPAPQQGPIEKVVTPVTDTVGDVTRPVTDTVGGILSPVTGALTGGGEQPAMTMINPLGDLLGG